MNNSSLFCIQFLLLALLSVLEWVWGNADQRILWRKEPGNEARGKKPGNEARGKEPGNEARGKEPANEEA